MKSKTIDSFTYQIIGKETITFFRKRKYLITTFIEYLKIKGLIKGYYFYNENLVTIYFSAPIINCIDTIINDYYDYLIQNSIK